MQRKADKHSIITVNKIMVLLKLLEEKGLSLGAPYIKHIDAEIWELRPVRDRILFAQFHNNKFIILSHFIKKSQKTPCQEIEKAKRLFKNYIRRDDVK